MTKEIIPIVNDFNLPDHNKELSNIEHNIGRIKILFGEINKNGSITDKIHDDLYEKTIKILSYLGKLSTPCFAISRELEEMYIFNYPKSPKLSKKLWLDHYRKIHHPYSFLKNKCYSILDNLDDEYNRVHKKHPPNWNTCNYY